MANNLTFQEFVLIDKIIGASVFVMHGATVDVGFFGIVDIIEQGVFTQQTLDDLLLRAARHPDSPIILDSAQQLVADLTADGDIAIAPAPFTSDEQAQMKQLALCNSSDIHGIIVAAEHVQFWSEIELAHLTAKFDSLGPKSQAAITALVADEVAGGQILPSDPAIIIGVENHHNHF